MSPNSVVDPSTWPPRQQKTTKMHIAKSQAKYRPPTKTALLGFKGEILCWHEAHPIQKKCLLHFIAACHEDFQNSRTAYEIQLHLTWVTTTTNQKKILCCSTKHHDIETPLLRCHHKYTESVLSHHPPRARENRVGVMNTSHQAETADGIQFTFSLKPCEMSK